MHFHSRAVFLHLDMDDRVSASWNLPKVLLRRIGSVMHETNRARNLLILSNGGWALGVLKADDGAVLWESVEDISDIFFAALFFFSRVPLRTTNFTLLTVSKVLYEAIVDPEKSPTKF